MTAEAKVKSDTFAMPEVMIGDVVNWYADGDRNQLPVAAIVTRKHQRTLGLTLIQPDTRNLVIKDGVRHVGDPQTRTFEYQENGGWDHGEQAKRIIELEGKISRILKVLGKKAE